MRCSKDLAQKEGIFVGITSGATFAGALQICAEAPKGANILCMLPDTGERYLSTPLFADVPADMTEEEAADLQVDADGADAASGVIPGAECSDLFDRYRDSAVIPAFGAVIQFPTRR